MNEVKRYRLELHFDATQLDKQVLQDKVEALIGKWLGQVGFEVKEVMDGKAVQVEIVGGRDDVAACHGKISHNLYEDHPFFRYLDEVGDEIRQQAYPILAQIEHSLRVFINQAMVEVHGFSWWEEQIPTQFQQHLIRLATSDKLVLSGHHVLEWLFFDDLVSWVTASFYPLPPDGSLTAADLVELLDKHESVQSVKAAIEAQMSPISYWDEVFAHYFDDREGWKALEKKLQSVIRIRNKVMHHRPVRPDELGKLQEIKQQLETALSMARRKLPETELREAQQASSDIRKAARHRRQSPFFGTVQDLLGSRTLDHLDTVQDALGDPALDHLDTVQDLLGSSSLDHLRTLQDLVGGSSLYHLRTLQDLVGGPTIDRASEQPKVDHSSEPAEDEEHRQPPAPDT